MKRVAWMGTGAVVALAGCVFLGLELRARMWEGRWKEFVAHWEANGESFGIGEHLPPSMADEEEFARHPFIRRIAAGEPEVLKKLGAMDLSGVEGYEKWSGTFTPEDTHVPMPEELARRVLDHAAGFEAELDAFAEAVRRPGSRIEVEYDGEVAVGAPWQWLSQLPLLQKLLEGAMHAAAALGDAGGLTEGVETSLCAGNHLRNSNLTLARIIGIGFEAGAYEVLEALPVLSVWPSSTREEWAAALEFRDRILAEEFPAAMRVERGILLSQLPFLENEDSARGRLRITQLRRVHFARVRLFACEPLQGMVLSSAGVPESVVDAQRVERFAEYAKRHRDSRNQAEAFAYFWASTSPASEEHLLLHEETRRKLARRLRAQP